MLSRTCDAQLVPIGAATAATFWLRYGQAYWSLPEELHTNLDQAWRPHCGNPAEVRSVAGVCIGLLELWVIPGVEHFSPEEHSLRFSLSKSEGLLYAEIPIVKAGTVENLWLDELHGIRLSIRGHDGKWPVATVKFVAAPSPHR